MKLTTSMSTLFLTTLFLAIVSLTNGQQSVPKPKQSVQLTVRPKVQPKEASENDVISPESSSTSTTSSAIVSNDGNVIVSNGTVPGNDTEITFWTPIITYWEKIPKYLSSIPGLKYPVSFVTILTANLVSLALVAATAFMSFFFSPNAMKVITKLTEQLANFSTMNPSTVEELARRVNLAVESYGKVDPEVCLRMASCTLGKERKRKDVSNGSLWPATTYGQQTLNSTHGQKPIHPMLMGIQLLDNFLRYMNPERYTTVSKEYRSGREFGESGGDCDTFNRKKQCPLDSKSWNLLLNSLSSVIYQWYH